MLSLMYFLGGMLCGVCVVIAISAIVIGATADRDNR
jgi:hypothetical protein